jgi:hypothetical protein
MQRYEIMHHGMEMCAIWDKQVPPKGALQQRQHNAGLHPLLAQPLQNPTYHSERWVTPAVLPTLPGLSERIHCCAARGVEK